MIPRRQITGAILAGGRGRRMGAADKGSVPLLGRPLIAHAIERLHPQVGDIIISANRHLEYYSRWGLPVFRDHDDGYSGPLAGVARALEVASTPFVMVVPCDMPFLPAHLVGALAEALSRDGEAAVARSAGHLQALCLLLKREVAVDLAGYRDSGGAKVRDWLQRLSLRVVDFKECPEAFCNINTPEKLQAAALT